MDHIPVEFDYNDQHYKGHFTAVSGAGGKTFFLTVDGFHKGQLVHTESYGWQFHSNNNQFKELTQFFADVVTAWLQ